MYKDKIKECPKCGAINIMAHFVSNPVCQYCGFNLNIIVKSFSNINVVSIKSSAQKIDFGQQETTSMRSRPKASIPPNCLQEGDDIYSPDWDKIVATISLASMDIYKWGFKTDHILAVARGGLPIATILSHLMDIPLIPIIYSSKNGTGEGKHINQLPFVKNANLLIVDDISDSGHTLKEIKTYYTHMKNNIRTFTLYLREGTVFTPDLYAFRIPSFGDGGKYVNFPWEPLTKTKTLVDE